MKKFILIMLFFFLISLFGCNQNQKELKVLVPNGIPSIALAYLEYNQENSDYLVERVTGPAPLIAAFTSGSHDVIVAPINIGANLYQKQSPYQLAGVLTWSNLQLISRTEITNLNELSGKNIIAYGAGAVPEMIIGYLFGSLNLETEANISYQASSAQESLVKFLQDENSIAIISEPVTSSAKTLVDNLYVIDLGNLWMELTDLDLFPQAGIFINRDLNQAIIDRFLEDLNFSTDFALNNPKETADYCVEMNYPYEGIVIENAIPNSGIDYQSSINSKLIVEAFLEMILDFKAELIGGSLPDDTFYRS